MRYYLIINLFNILNRNDDLFKYFQQESSKFDKILEDPNLSIEKLLDEETIINEFRGCNPRLLQKMKNYDFNKMVKFIIEEPSEQDDQKRQFKYPFIACELLTCNVGIIPDQFFEREPLAIDDEESETTEHEMPIEEDHSETAGEQQNGIQIKESLSDTSEEDNEELSKQPMGRFSMTGDQLNKIEQEGMEIEKDEDANGQSHQENGLNVVQENSECQENKQTEQQETNQQQEDNKNEMDISQEMNMSTEQAQLDGKVIEEQITLKAEEIFSETILQVLEEKRQQEQQRKELEQKYEKIPQDNMYLFGLLLSFFDTKKEVNITLSGYVAKVFQHILSLAKNKSKEPEVIEYIYKNESSLLSMTNHMHSRSCAEILIKSLSYTNSLQKGKFLSAKFKIIDRLIQLLSEESNDLEVFANVVLVISELINTYTNYTDGKQMLEYIISQPVLVKILDNLNSTSSKIVFHNANVICNLIQLFNVIDARRNDEDDSQFKEFDVSFNDALQLFSQYVKATIDYLKNYKQEETIITAFRQELKPLGQARLKIIEMYCVALKLDNFYVIQEIAQHNLHEVLLDLVLAYEWNNMLHTLVERIIIQSAQINSHAMRKAVFTDAKLINFLLKSTRQVDSNITENTSKPISFRKGYLGHVTKIANFVQRLCENNPEIQEYVDLDAWTELRDTFLDQTNKNNNKDLGDHAIIEHDSPHSQLHCSYDIEEIKQKSEDFLFGIPQYQNDKLHEQENHENDNDDDNKESDEMFFSNIAKSIQQDDDKKEENRQESQQQDFGFENPFFNSYPMTTSQDKQQKFEGFGFFDIQPSQENQENQEQKQSYDDIFKSFEFSTSPQMSPSQAPAAADQILSQHEQEQQQQLIQQQQQQDNQQNGNNNALDIFSL